MGFYIDMINVGEGDSFLLTLEKYDSSQAYVLIDAGTEARAEDVIRHLTRCRPPDGILDLMIATHLDRDHIGGFESALDHFRPRAFVINTPGNLPQWLELRRNLSTLGTPESVRTIVEDLAVANSLVSKIDRLGIPRFLANTSTKPLVFGTTTLTFLNPDPVQMLAAWADQVLTEIREEYARPVANILARLAAPSADRLGSFIAALAKAGRITAWATEANDSSIVIELSYQNAPYALFTADAGAGVLRRVTAGKQYRYLKVSHHGSSTGLDEELLQQWRPSWAFIPVGDNPHGHPDLQVLKILKKFGVVTFCSERTRYCRKLCQERGFGTVRHRQDKPPSHGWRDLNPLDCRNNDPGLQD